MNSIPQKRRSKSLVDGLVVCYWWNSSRATSNENFVKFVQIDSFAERLQRITPENRYDLELWMSSSAAYERVKKITSRSALRPFRKIASEQHNISFM